MNLIEHAKREFLAAGYDPVEECEDGPNKWIQENVIELLEVFSKQGHSGHSAPYAINTFKKLADYKPLGPIMCTDEEWGEPYDDDHYQNKRLSSVFKDGKEGIPYYLNAIVWQGEDSWNTFTGTVEGVSSLQYIKLPFTPKTFYVDVTRELYNPQKHSINSDNVVSCGTGDYVYAIKDRSQLKEVFEYYNERKPSK